MCNCHYQRTVKTSIIFFSMCCALTIGQYIYAEDEVADKFKIAFGGYALVRSESEMSLTGQNFGLGGSISPEDTLGMETEQTVLRIDGHYHYNKHHALTFSWYRISTDGTKKIEKQIDWVDENGDPITIPIGAQVNTSLEYDIYKFGYLWSFYHTDKVELAAGLGLHLTRIAVGFDAETTSTGIDAKDAAMTVPLPVLSLGLKYTVTPNFGWFLKSEIFSIEYDKWQGTYTDSSLGVEYRAWKNIGLGIGFGTNSLKVSEETDEYKFTFANRISGITLYVSGNF